MLCICPQFNIGLNVMYMSTIWHCHKMVIWYRWNECQNKVFSPILSKFGGLLWQGLQIYAYCQHLSWNIFLDVCLYQPSLLRWYTTVLLTSFRKSFFAWSFIQKNGICKHLLQFFCHNYLCLKSFIIFVLEIMNVFIFSHSKNGIRLCKNG